MAPLPMAKRKRSSGKTTVVKMSSAGPRKVVAFRPGYDRTSGFYGATGNTTEDKFFDFNHVSAVVSSGGFISPSINLIVQGTGENERVGRKITIKKINVRFTVALGIGSAGGGDVIRCMLVLDKQCNGTAATVGQVLHDIEYDSFNNLSNKRRFRVLSDKFYTLNHPAGAGSAPADVVTNVFADDKKYEAVYKDVNVPIEFDQAGAPAVTIANVRSNNIFLLLHSRSGLGLVKYKSRIRYSDA